MDGIVFVDKPAGITSHDVVDRLRRPAGTRRVGHAGTLDPIATGLLVIGIGKATRALEFFEGLSKEYRVQMRLGVSTDTLDRQGKVEREMDASGIRREKLDAVLRSFLGKYEQEVPAYSAVRVGGEKLYEKARRGEVVAAPRRTVEIHEVELIGFSPPLAEIRVVCSKGCYVRALARDVGARLENLAICEEVRRTKVGPIPVEQAVPLDAIEDGARLLARLLPVDQALAFFPEVRVGLEHQGKFLHGQVLDLRPNASKMRIYGPSGFLGIGASSWDRYIKPLKVLA